MNADKSADLLGQMDEDLQHMLEITPHLRWLLRDATAQWNALGDSQVFPNDLTLTEDFDTHLDRAVACAREVKEDLRDFDWLLANLIRLRGNLAEQLGVPMMSHLDGPDGFGRESAEFQM